MPLLAPGRAFMPLKLNSPQMRRVNLQVRAEGFRSPVMAELFATEAKGRAKDAMARLGFTPKNLEVVLVPDHVKEKGAIGFSGGRIVISPLDLNDTLFEHAIGHLALANDTKKAKGSASALASWHVLSRRELAHEASRNDLRGEVEGGAPITPALQARIQAFLKSDIELARLNVPNSPKTQRIKYALDELFADAATVQVKRQLRTTGSHTDFGAAPQVAANETQGMLKTAPTRSWLGTFFTKAGFKDPTVMKALSDAVVKLMNQQSRRGELTALGLNRALRRELMPILRKHLSRSELQIEVVQPAPRRSAPSMQQMDLAQVFKELTAMLNAFDARPQPVPWQSAPGITGLKTSGWELLR